MVLAKQPEQASRFSVLSIYSAKERITTVAEKDRVAIKDEETGQRLTLEAREVFEQYHAYPKDPKRESWCQYVRFVPSSSPRQACPECGKALDQRRSLALLPPRDVPAGVKIR